MGEIFSSIFKRLADSEARIVSLNFLELTLSEQLQGNKVRIVTFKQGDTKYIKKIKQLDNRITSDDALHLSKAIKLGCQFFITIDRMLLNEETVKRIEQELRIKIKHPSA